MSNPSKFPEELNQERIFIQKSLGIKFFHITRDKIKVIHHNTPYHDVPKAMTIAYARDNPNIKHGDVYRISTSLVNNLDLYDRKKGCYTTAKQMGDGNWIYVRKRSNQSIEEFLANAFLGT